MSNSAPRRPNVLLIMADDLGYSDLGCYGGEIETPNLDTLAAAGTRFTHFYNNAVCLPTRASLLTGLWPQQATTEQGHLTASKNQTIAEVLSATGYRTLMVGKWHNGHTPEAIPFNRGFDRHWGLLSGCCNYFNPGLQRPGEAEPAHKAERDYRHWGDDATVLRPYTPEDPDFYVTDAYTDRAVSFLEQYGREDRPFLLYLAHNAPHFPMQARPADIERYRGCYLAGWDELRGARFERQQALGVVPPGCRLSPRDPRAPSWGEIPRRDQDSWDLKMAVYAAMVDCMDRGIGRILETLDRIGERDNTLIIFLSDNGACAEPIHRTPEVQPGPMDGYHTVDLPWANMSNTPFRLFKVFEHEGGIRAPAIISPPAAWGPPAASHCSAVCHVADVMPTLLELCGATYPQEVAGTATLPLVGRSFTGALDGTTLSERPPLYWHFRGACSARIGNWKLVTEGPPRRHVGNDVTGDGSWELYDLAEDPTELGNLAESQRDRRREMVRSWHDWSRRVGNGHGTGGPTPAEE